MSINKKRYSDIDFFRGLAIIVLIFIHVSLYNQRSPYFLWNFSYFAIPLFVFSSGYVLLKKYKKFTSTKDFFSFLKKRFKRLLLPYYLYLFFNFLLTYIFTTVNKEEEIIALPLNREEILGQILLLGNPYINWFVVLFLSLALFFPFLTLIIRKRKTFLSTFYLIMAITILLVFKRPSIELKSLKFLLFIPWLLPFLFAYFYDAFRKSGLKRFTLMLVFFILFTTQGYLLQTNHLSTVLRDNQYPPNFYYFSYGFFWLFLLSLIFDLDLFKERPVTKFFAYFSRHSYSLFFIHYLTIQFFFYQPGRVLSQLFNNDLVTSFLLFIYITSVSVLINGFINRATYFFQLLILNRRKD